MPSNAVLVIAPHGLDEVLGCGGTIALHAGAGHKVHILILCGDGTGHDARRRTAAAEASRILGAEPPRFGGFPENRSDTVPLTEVVGTIEKVLADVQPAVAYVSHGGNLNIDHQTAFRATATALRPMPGISVSDFYSYEIPSSTDWAPPGLAASFRPTRFVDIGPTLARKMKALEIYSFEMRPEPHARSIPAAENLARTRGAAVGLAAAEAFMVERSIFRDAQFNGDQAG